MFILPADKNKTLAQKVIEWKFDQLDKNKDEILKRRETRTIKRMVRKLIQPKACARMFLEYCDSDGDRMIKKKEWTYCLNTNASSSEYQYLFSFTKKNSTMLTIILSVFRGFVCAFTKKIILLETFRAQMVSKPYTFEFSIYIRENKLIDRKSVVFPLIREYNAPLDVTTW